MAEGRLLQQQRLEALLALALLTMLVLGCLWVLAPFLTALAWSVILCFSTWGLYERLLAATGNRRIVTALLMTVLQAAIILLPVVVVALSLGDHVAHVDAALRRLATAAPPPVPGWLAGLPVVGPEIAARWAEVTADGASWVQSLRRLIAPLSGWLLDTGLAFGGGFLYLLLSVLASFFFYRDGAAAVRRLQAALDRLGGERARRLLGIAGSTIRGVVYGIIGTALAQATLAALGFAIGGVPGPIFLGLLTFLLSPVPFGPPLVWAPAAIWLYGQGQVFWAAFVALWGLLLVSTIDNVLKPILIGRESALPFLLVLLGIIGGALAFGVIGVFLGPTLLALGYNLLREWTHEADAPGRRRAPGEPAAHTAGSGTE